MENMNGGGMKAYRHRVLFCYDGTKGTSSSVENGHLTCSLIIDRDDATPFDRDSLFNFLNGKTIDAKGLFYNTSNMYQLLFLQGFVTEFTPNLKEINAYGVRTDRGTSNSLRMANNGVSEECYTITDYVEPNT